MDTDILVTVAEHGGAMGVIIFVCLLWVRARVRDGKITVCIGSATAKEIELRAIRAEKELTRVSACLDCERAEKDESQKEFIAWLKAEKKRRNGTNEDL